MKNITTKKEMATIGAVSFFAAMLLTTLILALTVDIVLGNDIGVKISGGDNAKRADSLFTVWFTKAGDSSYSCGGTLLEADWVLTAATCFDGNEPLISYKVIVGDYRTNREDGEVIVQPDSYTLHPDYDSGTRLNNLAVVHLSTTVNTSADTIETVPRLSTTNLDKKIAKKDRCLLTSFGPDETGELPNRIQSVKATVQEDGSCSGIQDYNNDTNLCYTADPGSPCTGDEGAPIGCLIGRDMTLVGVHSIGSCTTGSHAASQISFYRRWILRTLESAAPISCGDVPNIRNGEFESNGTNVLNDNATLICDQDFVLISDNPDDVVITCQSDGNWSEISAACLSSCGVPPVIDNASYSSNGTNVENDTALVECLSGYLISSTIASDATITCQENGNWTTTDVSCLLVCDSLPETSNGTFVLSGRNVVNDTALLTCDNGFGLTSSSEADATISCGEDGSWESTDVTCQISCGGVPAIDDGIFMTNGTNVFNDTAVLKCNTDYVLSSDVMSDATITCQENGNWTTSTTTCLRVCEALPVVLNGSFALNGDNVEYTTAVLVCDQGFETSSTNASLLSIQCQENGMWTSTDAYCIRSCGTVPLALNGSFVTDGRDIVNDTAVLQCDEGYKRSADLDIDSAITCQEDGNWDSTTATCIRSCGEVPMTMNGTFESNGTNIVNDNASLVCDEGYLPSSNELLQITCQSNGSWSSIATICLKECGLLPSILNGSYILTGDGVVNDNADLVCDNGFVKTSDNSAIITCQNDGSWSSSDVGCIRSCGVPPVIDNASYSSNGSNVENDTAVVECISGYLISSDIASDASITCQENGNWTTTDVSCLFVCGSLPETSNGTFVLIGRNVVNDTALLTCDNGFGLTSSSEADATIACGEDGSWESTDVTCQISCGGVPAIDDGIFMTNGTNVFNDTAVLKCNTDYVLSSDVMSDATITCQENGNWTTATTTCLRVCEALPVVLNGSFALNGDNVEYTTAVLVCDQGYETSSTNASLLSIQCQEDGMWTSTDAYCIRSCGTVPLALNGSFVTDGRDIVNDTAVLQCDEGYKRSADLDIDSTITCQEDGNWDSTTATCIRSCGEVPMTMNGTFESNGTNIVNDNASLVCDEGYLPSSNELLQITCQSNGSWSSIATICLKECGLLPSILNGSYILTGDGVVNDNADLVCDNGFVKTSDNSAIITCQNDGSWSSSDVGCIRSCGVPPVIDNASYSSNGSNVENDTAVVECISGYLISSDIASNATITCQENGNWTTTDVSCLLVCDSLPETSNGTFVLSGRNVVNDTALLTCDNGFGITSSSEADATIACGEDGSWESTDVTCQISCGGVPAIDDGIFMTNGTNVFNDTAVLKCNTDYVLSSDVMSDATITCQENGNWTTSTTTCLRVCEALPVVLNGSFALNGDNVEYTTAVLVCDQGYETSSTNASLLSIQCQEDGMWTSTDAYCIRSCGTVPLALNGSFVTDGRDIVNDTAVLQCDEGYKKSADLDIDSTITCQEDGNWDSTTATCIRSCGEVPMTMNGTFESNGTNIVNDNASLVCDEGYLPSSNELLQITCQSNGSWSSIATICLKECGLLPSILNGSYILTGDGVVNDNADLVCDNGFVKTSDNSAIITCQNDGSWSSSDVGCIRSCGVLPVIDNASYSSNGSNVENDTAVVECISGYLISSDIASNATITCQENGNWTTTDVSCLLVCDSLPETSNGTFVLSGRNVVNDTALLTCDNGFGITSSSEADATIACREDGSWESTDVTCQISCGGVPTIDDGIFMTNGTDVFNDTAVLKCNTDYVLSSDVMSDATITCQENGNWTTSTTTCLRVCEALPVVLNGSFALNGDNIEYTTAELVCDQGFETSSTNVSLLSIQCQEDGLWTSTDAYCIRSCGTVPLALNGSFVTDGRDIVNDTAVLQCDEGYESSADLDIDSTITCQEDGNWDITTAKCIRYCGPPSVSTNGIYISNGSNVEHDSATLVCNRGYRISSDLLADATITCQNDGTWTSHSVICDQECSSAGTSFVFGYLEDSVSRSRPYIHIFASEPTSVTINVPYYPDQLTVQVDKFANIRLSGSIAGSGQEEESNKGVEVYSDHPITVYSSYVTTKRRNPSAGSTLIIPEQCASTEYMIVSHSNLEDSRIKSEFMVIGLEDNTEVSIELPSGLTKTINLGRYGTYQYQDQDVTGAIVRANAKISTMSGHMCAYVPSENTRGCDYIVESMPPLSSLKKAYVLSYMKPRLNFAVRIVAANDGTTIAIRNAIGDLIEDVSLNKAQNYFTNFIDNSTISITSDKNILVAQYGHGTQSDRLGFGDPSMAILPAIGQYKDSYEIYASSSFRENYLTVFIRSSDDISGLRLNGEQFNASDVISVAVPGYGHFEIVYIKLIEELNTIAHIINGTTFGVQQYGFRREVEYSLVPGRIF